MKEEIIKALHSAQFLSAEILAAHSKACTADNADGRLIALILYPMIEQARKLETQLETLEQLL